MAILTAEYQPLVASARARLTNDPRLSAMLAPHLEPAVLHRFLIQFSAWGVRLTEPVDGWIHRAGERCVACGYQTLGQALVRHAQDEAGHHLMFLKDLDYLLASWHAHGYEPLTADAVLAMPSSTAMQRYIDLHETAITSDEPFVQIAIEYEIESMATSLGPHMVRQCLNVLGPESVQGLSFVEEHVKLDIGHTAFTQRQLSDFLEAHPRAVVPLARAGSTALNAYVDFLGDCLDVARRSPLGRSLPDRSPLRVTP